MTERGYDALKEPEPDFCFLTVDGNREISEELLRFFKENFYCDVTTRTFRANKYHKGVFWQIRILGVRT